MIRRTIAVIGLGLAALLAFGPAASAAVPASYQGLDAGWDDIFDPTGSGSPTEQASSYLFTVGTGTVVAFCADQTKALNPDASFTLAAATDTWAARAAYIAANHATIGTPALDDNDEAAATQIAIWTLTNGVTIDASTVPDATVRARATELAASTTTLAVPVLVDPVLAVTASIDGADLVTAATLSGVDDVEGQTVSFTLGTETVTATTNAEGVAVHRFTGVGFGTVIASALVTVGPGVMLVPTDGSQPLITATATDLTASGQAVVVPDTPTTIPDTPTTVAPNTPTTAPVGPQLPYTGQSTSPWLFVTAISLIVLAGVIALRLRAAQRA